MTALDPHTDMILAAIGVWTMNNDTISQSTSGDKLYHVARYWHYIDNDNYRTSDLADVWLIRATYPIEAIEMAIVDNGEKVADYPEFTETSLSKKKNRDWEYSEYEAVEIDPSSNIVRLL